MNTITQKMYFRLSLIKYADRYGVSKAAIQYNVNRQYVYRWKNDTMATLSRLEINPADHPIILMNIHRQN